jgi:N-acetylglucosamine-6-phosphate deacetylase
MSAAADRDGRFLLGELPVSVVDGVARLVDGGAIAGSTLTMDAAVRYAVHSVGLSPQEAFASATCTPAKLLGMSDRGSLEVGRRADLCHLDAALHVTQVWVAGAIVP